MRATTSGENPVNWVVSITRSARSSESDARTDAFADSPKIATIATSARPITERARRGRGAARVPHRVPRAIAPVTPVTARTGRPEHARQGTGERGEQDDHAEEEEQGTEPDDAELADQDVVGALGLGDADEEHRCARRDQRTAGEGAAAERERRGAQAGR